MPAFKPKQSTSIGHSKAKSDEPTETEVLSKAIIKVAKKLDLSQKELSEILDVSPLETNSLISISPTSNEGKRALLLIRIYQDLDSLLGDDENQSREWFKSYNHHLKGKPMELCKNLMGLTATVRYLDAMRGLA